MPPSKKRPPPAPRHGIVFDVEFTAWDGSMARRWSGKAEHTEVVQIGAVKIDIQSLKPVDEFEILVCPRVNPELSDYLVNLTGISRERLRARGVDYVTAHRAFLGFVGDGIIAAWGRDDLILETNLKLYGFLGALPIPPYVNVVPMFQAFGIDTAGKHACDAAGLAGATFEGRAHDGLADAHGVALAVRMLVERGAANPFLHPYTDKTP